MDRFFKAGAALLVISMVMVMVLVLSGCATNDEAVNQARAEAQAREGTPNGELSHGWGTQ